MKTFLYIKQHELTGLQYFGKTNSADPYKYPGSGKYWNYHIRKHGKKFVKTIWVMEFENIEECKEFAMWFSRHYDIVKSDKWANLIEENGTDGAPIGNKNNKGRHFSKDWKSKMSKSKLGNQNRRGIPHSKAIKDKISKSVSISLKGYKHPILMCPHCGKLGSGGNMKRYHFDKCSGLFS